MTTTQAQPWRPPLATSRGRWEVKAFAHRVLSAFPEAQRINRLVQRYVTRSLAVDDAYVLDKWSRCQRHLEAYRRHANGARANPVVLEIGTGWLPIAPVALSLLGAKRVITVDRESLFGTPELLAVVDRVAALIAAGRARPHDPQRAMRMLRRARRGTDRPVSKRLADLGISSIIADGAHTGLPDDCIDLSISNNTLEHIPEPDLLPLLREQSRLVGRDGVVSHYVDLADHFANFDPTITVFNFLRFPAPVWELINSPLQYQNRLRASDYRALLAKAGCDLLCESHRDGGLAALRSVPLAPEFRTYAEDDLRVCKAWLVSR